MQEKTTENNTDKEIKKKKMSGKKKALLVVLFILLLLASVVFVAGYMFFNPVNSGPSPAGKHYKNKPITKSEMVYVDTDPSGKPQSVVVDAYLRNNTENKIITDKTNLTDIVNINGNEQFKRSGNGTITWPANGNDIYYEGIAEKGDVPITMKVTYYLDGKKIKGEDLEGKSGNLEIHIRYKNNTSVNIKGKKVPVPFMVLSAVIIHNNTLTKVKIDNGKVISEAGLKVIVGFAAPGLSKTLGTSMLKDGIGQKIVIKGVAKNFRGNEIISVVSSDMLKAVSNKSLDKLNVDKKIAQLDKATKQIVKGSQQLTDGIELLKERTPELTGGIKQAKDGAVLLALKTKEALVKLKAGSKSLYDLGTVLYMAADHVNNRVSGTDEEKGLADLAKEHKENLQLFRDQQDKLVQQTETVSAELAGLRDLVAQSTTMSEEEKVQYLEALNRADAAQDNVTSLANEQKTLLESGESTDEDESNEETVQPEEMEGGILAEADQLSAGLNETELILNGLETDEIPDWITEIIEEAELEGIEEIEKLEQLKKEDGSYMGLVEMMAFWNEKNLQMYKALHSMAYDKDSLAAGTKTLAAGMRKLNAGGKELYKGAGQLSKGSNMLSKGLAKYYKQAIGKIVKLYNEQIKDVPKNVKRLKIAGEKYNNFSGIADDMDGSVKFTYFTPIGSW